MFAHPRNDAIGSATLVGAVVAMSRVVQKDARLAA